MFCNWINSLGPEVEMTDLLEDAKSGVRLLEVIEKISADKKIVDWKMVNKKAKVQIKSIENCNYLVTCAQALGCHIVNLGGKDIFDQNEKLVTPRLYALTPLSPRFSTLPPLSLTTVASLPVASLTSLLAGR